MITKFKIFESNDVEKYIGNIIINEVDTDDPDYTTDSVYTIYVCRDIRGTLTVNNKLYVEFDCFDIDKDYIIKSVYGDSYQLADQKIKELPFLTTMEFYNQYTDICIGFYKSIRAKYEDEKENGYQWMIRMLKDCKDLLETIPEFQHYASAEKYNL